MNEDEIKPMPVSSETLKLFDLLERIRQDVIEITMSPSRYLGRLDKPHLRLVVDNTGR